MNPSSQVQTLSIWGFCSESEPSTRAGQVQPPPVGRSFGGLKPTLVLCLPVPPGNLCCQQHTWPGVPSLNEGLSRAWGCWGLPRSSCKTTLCSVLPYCVLSVPAAQTTCLSLFLCDPGPPSCPHISFSGPEAHLTPNTHPE